MNLAIRSGAPLLQIYRPGSAVTAVRAVDGWTAGWAHTPVSALPLVEMAGDGAAGRDASTRPATYDSLGTTAAVPRGRLVDLTA